MKTIEIDGERFRLVRVYNGNNIEEYALSPVNKEPQEPEEAEDKEELWERFFKMYPEYKEMIQKYSDKPATPDEPEWEVKDGEWTGQYEVLVSTETTPAQAEALKASIEALMDWIYADPGAKASEAYDKLNIAKAKASTLIQRSKDGKR